MVLIIGTINSLLFAVLLGTLILGKPELVVRVLGPGGIEWVYQNWSYICIVYLIIEIRQIIARSVLQEAWVFVDHVASVAPVIVMGIIVYLVYFEERIALDGAGEHVFYHALLVVIGDLLLFRITYRLSRRLIGGAVPVDDAF
ncbi:hypothetical protein COU20_01635 [Candidatus Kaiserbacteria bacterium CG10_big_fil_rev_8_21_14_0_10_59_10]|uniref:Uncharacterized protein n=1 Tax=Candidatus Kaiserbacteria bacterium CG10_big_fil_rev_8_21_14_0_10_59_10 TaxID=1974612 RepID=A0A2H0UA54_9BACT|nr:MAG: hypothetical protein COU20_01635 [Candidatus Kaiserbacteria bacterium CG10_big_fil_rev_8_21_14_0_10_59_10]